MPNDAGAPGRDWLELLPRSAWVEPWASMDSGATVPPPNDLEDPETFKPPGPMLVPVVTVRDRSCDHFIAALEAANVELIAVRNTWARSRRTLMDRRTAVLGSVLAARDLVKGALPDGHELITHLDVLATAIVDAHNGRPTDWLEAVSTGGRPAGVREVVGVQRGQLAAIVELLMAREKRTSERAAQMVRSAIPDRHKVWGSGKPSWKAVKRWRDYDVKVDGSAEKAGYEDQLAEAALSPEVSAEKLLRGIRHRWGV
jgi:hypothetical protein